VLKAKAIRILQNGRTFYVLSLTASQLVKNTKVDVWDPSGPEGRQGYQRAPSRSRKRKVAQYVSRDDAVMPQGGLLNARSATGNAAHGEVLNFEADWENGAIASGELTIPTAALPLYVVDMQHRIGGYEYAINEDGQADLDGFPLVVTIADGLSFEEEVDQFEIINTTQKKVRTDLARRLKAMQMSDHGKRAELEASGKLWEARGPKIVTALVEDSSGPWYKRITPPNATKKNFPDAIVRETSFVTSLKPILKSPYFTIVSDEDAAELIGRFWKAIAKLYPAAVGRPRDYVLQKTPGVFSLHAIAPQVFEISRSTCDGQITIEGIVRALEPMAKTYDASFWSSDEDDGASQYGSMKGFRILAVKLQDELPKLQLGSM